jgi:hypothetical protein
MAKFIKRNEDGSIWIKRAPGSLSGMDGVLTRGSITLSPGDADYPFWDEYLKDLEGQADSDE